MKQSILFLAIIAGSLIQVHSQSLDEIKTLVYVKKDFSAAKLAIDEHLAIEKNAAKPDGWNYKASIYNQLSYTENISLDEIFQLRSDAYRALLTYLPLETKKKPVKEPMVSTDDLFANFYFGFLDVGIRSFNEKKFDTALRSFKLTLEINDSILSKKLNTGSFKASRFDTSVVLNAAAAAAQAQKGDEAEKYFKLIVNEGIAGADFMNVYEYLANYYNQKGMKSEFEEILKKARVLYPTNDYWNVIEIESVEKTGDEKLLMDKYEEMIAADKSNFALLYDYAVVLYNKLFNAETKVSNQVEIQKKLHQTLTEAVKYDKGIDACFMMSNFLYGLFSDQHNEALRIKGNKPEDVKKKKELIASENKTMDELLKYSDIYLNYMDALPELKPVQMANYRSIAGNVAEVYESKGNTAKAAEYEKRRKAKS